MIWNYLIIFSGPDKRNDIQGMSDGDLPEVDTYDELHAEP